jgi:hypothetical protein
VTAARTRAAPGRFPFITALFTDAAYAGDRAAKATCIRLEIIGGQRKKTGIAVQPRRWVVEGDLGLA